MGYTIFWKARISCRGWVGGAGGREGEGRTYHIVNKGRYIDIFTRTYLRGERVGGW